MGILSDIGTGISNFWYTLTGQPEKTSSYQALVKREDELRSNAYQTAAADMEAAGLSKYGLTGGASSNTGVSGESNQVQRMKEALELKGIKTKIESDEIDNDEKAYNLGIARSLGIRTNDPNYAGKWATLGNVLFGFDPTSVDGGIIPYLFRLLTGKGSDVPSGSGNGSATEYSNEFMSPYSKSALEPILAGASTDQASQIMDNLKNLRSMNDKEITDFITNAIVKHHSTGQGKTNDYSSLPPSLQNLSNGSLSSDVRGLVSMMKQKGQTSDYVVERIVDFLAKKYNTPYNEVMSKVKELL